MVGSDDDECLVWMLLIELVSYLHGIVHIDEFADESGVVCVASPVDLAAFYHEEEAIAKSLLLHEEVDTCASDVLQGKVVLRTVECIGDATVVNFACSLSLEENHLVGLLALLLVVLVAAGNGVTASLSLCIEVWTAIWIVGLNEITSSKEVKARAWQLRTNLVSHAALWNMRVESRRSRVIDAHTGRYADCRTCIMSPLSNACNGCL